MNPPTKIFIIDSDRLSLVTLSLWLDQVKDFEIVGTSLATGNLERRIIDSQPDLVFFNIASSNGIGGIDSLATLRRLKQVRADLPVILLYEGDKKDLDGHLALESDAQISPEASLKELVETMKKLGYKQKVVSGSHLYMVKAG